MSTITYQQHLPHSLHTVWDYHRTPGAVVRLTPGFSRVRVLRQAHHLRNGLTRMRFPGGLVWEGQHDPQGYRPPADDNRTATFTDTCATPFLGSATGWRHHHEFRGDAHHTTLTDHITTHAPSALSHTLLDRIFAYRHRQLAADLHHLHTTQQWATPHSTAMTIAVTGATGLVGTQLCALLRLAGHRIITLSRHAASAHRAANAPGSPNAPGTGTGSTAHTPDPTIRHWDPQNPAADLLHGIDAVVNLAGHPIAGRFTHKHLRAVRDSRIDPTRRLAELAARTPGVHTFINASAVGYYGYQQPTPTDETAAQPGGGVLAGVVAEWENATRPAQDAGLRVALIRTGLVLAGGSPLLTLLQTAVRTGGGHLGNGRQHFAWIAIDDLTDIYHRALIDPTLHGPINAVAPDIVTNAQFTRALAHHTHSPLRHLQVPVPRLAPALLLGRRGAAELALADQHVRPSVLEHAGHPYRYPSLQEALAHELGG